MTQSDDESAKDQATPASMADLKTMETSLKSSMDTLFAETRDLLKQLASGKVPTETIPLEDSANSNDGDTEVKRRLRIYFNLCSFLFLVTGSLTVNMLS